jgi:hypothetical protein
MLALVHVTDVAAVCICLFSASVFDLEDISRTISSVVKIDRLPKNNSMEALLSLQDAWDHVDAYHQYANFYKVMTKMSYALLLLAGIATSIIAISRSTSFVLFFYPRFNPV